MRPKMNPNSKLTNMPMKKAMKPDFYFQKKNVKLKDISLKR